MGADPGVGGLTAARLEVIKAGVRVGYCLLTLPEVLALVAAAEARDDLLIERAAQLTLIRDLRHEARIATQADEACAIAAEDRIAALEAERDRLRAAVGRVPHLGHAFDRETLRTHHYGAQGIAECARLGGRCAFEDVLRSETTSRPPSQGGPA